MSFLTYKGKIKANNKPFFIESKNYFVNKKKRKIILLERKCWIKYLSSFSH